MITQFSRSLIFVAFFTVTAAFGQQTLEEEAWKFAQSYDKAIVESDSAFLEKHLDEQFISIGPNSAIMGKAESVAQAKRSAEKNDFRVIDLQSSPIKISVSGDLVVITSNWTVIRQATSIANAPPQKDSGTTTAVYRRGEVWRLLSEHVSFDRAPQTADLGRIGRRGAAFNHMLVNRNYADVELILAPSYLRVTPDGVSWNKSRFLDDLREARLSITSISTSSVYINRRENTAVETGVIEIGGSRNGSAFEAAHEYTRLWLKTDDTWRITAEYFTQPGR